ncbi:MAG TPA: hypothetical protein VKG05_03715 [Steroidobacteraceae bacterium]|nr:hypothetical protein [Steroidobacteraceae bacterium]
MKSRTVLALVPIGLLASTLLSAAVIASDLKDPTRPPAPLAPAQHSEKHIALPVVSAIFISGSRRVAVFNDQPVHEGDSVGAYRIESITAAGVHYRSAGQPAFAALATASD